MHVDRVELEDGRESTRECVDHPGGVSVAALTQDDEILLVRQYRYPYREVLLEAPAGKMDHPGEDPLSACKREQKEETGTWSSEYISLGELYPSPATRTNGCTYTRAASAARAKTISTPANF